MNNPRGSIKSLVIFKDINQDMDKILSHIIEYQWVLAGLVSKVFKSYCQWPNLTPTYIAFCAPYIKKSYNINQEKPSWE